ncbi:hypothetical protein Glove_551g52 [Diversispora epigaea]|uniref:Uncharacterized protein n=1 Tax=Diversispora epigaea TaxID=1348612 RepID=A0A397GK41_9GLOM|nr:hypothetical protein Glove_551g52 [Diversispora epigaea]
MSTTKDIKKIPYKGSFSYKNDDINSIDIDKKPIKSKTTGNKSSGSSSESYKEITKKYIKQKDLLPYCKLTKTLPSVNHFFVIWDSNYTLYKKGNAIFSLENQKQQAIRVAAVVRKDQVPSVNHFFVIWDSNYTLYKKGNAIFSLENQKQQAIRVAAVVRKVLKK